MEGKKYPVVKKAPSGEPGKPVSLSLKTGPIYPEEAVIFSKTLTICTIFLFFSKF